MITFSVRKLICIFFVTVLVVTFVSLNIKAKGRETQVSQNAGRMLKLKKIAITHDENGNFIFKNHREIIVSRKKRDHIIKIKRPVSDTPQS